MDASSTINAMQNVISNAELTIAFCVVAFAVMSIIVIGIVRG
jgi:hypothetical protein